LLDWIKDYNYAAAPPRHPGHLIIGMMQTSSWTMQKERWIALNRNQRKEVTEKNFRPALWDRYFDFVEKGGDRTVDQQFKEFYQMPPHIKRKANKSPPHPLVLPPTPPLLLQPPPPPQQQQQQQQTERPAAAASAAADSAAAGSSSSWAEHRHDVSGPPLHGADAAFRAAAGRHPPRRRAAGVGRSPKSRALAKT
jgi:hypothetical protein